MQNHGHIEYSLLLLAGLGLISLAWLGPEQKPPAQKPETDPSYTIVDLGTLSGSNSYPHAINNKGQVVGQTETANGSHMAFLWENGKMYSLGTLPGFPNSDASGINDSGQIVGQAENAGMVVYMRACLWENRKIVDLGTLPGYKYSSATAINNKGQILASAYDLMDPTPNNPTGIRSTLFLWEKGKRTPLLIAQVYTVSVGINNAGDVLGVSGSGGGMAFLYRNGKITELGSLGGKQSSGDQVDDQGRVVGEATTAKGTYHAYLYSQQKMTDLGTLGGDNSIAHGINAQGQIVGESDVKGDGKTMSHAFLYMKGKMIDLNDCIPPGSHWLLERANGINDKGQIICLGKQGDHSHAFLLSPVASETARPMGSKP